MSRNLPEFPNIDHLKKQAKALLRELQRHRPGTKLSQAQHTIAHRYGFASWPKLKAYIESLPRPTDPSPAADVAAPHSVGERGGRTSGPIDHGLSGGGSLFPRFTEKARRTIFFARYMALREDKRIEAEHLLLGAIQADLDLINHLLPGQFQVLPTPEPEEFARLKASLVERKASPLSSECKRVLEHAAAEADRLRHQKITAGHFLLGFLCEELAQATPILTEILREKGIPLNTARDEVARFLSEEHL